MSFALFLTVAVVFILLVACEIWWRRGKAESEFSRKFIHLTVGSFVAFWPFFLSWDQIRFLSLAFIVVIGISKQFHIFRSIHSVKRPTWGEVLFAVSVGLLTFITEDKWIYAASLLQMSLADGLAAIIGVSAKQNKRYKVFGHTKSVAGTLAFVVTSIIILTALHVLIGPLPATSIIAIGLLMAGLENISVVGLDNLSVPLATAVLIQLL